LLKTPGIGRLNNLNNLNNLNDPVLNVLSVTDGYEERQRTITSVVPLYPFSTKEYGNGQTAYNVRTLHIE